MRVRSPSVGLFAAVVAILALAGASGPGTARDMRPAASTVMAGGLSARTTMAASARVAAVGGPVLLGWTNNTVSGGTIGNFTGVEDIFTMSATPMPPSGEQWDLGRGMLHNTTGITNFTPASDPDLPSVAGLLTDGVNGFIELDTFFYPSGGGSGIGSSESYFFGRNPDFVGNEVAFVRLNISTLTLMYSAGNTYVLEAYTWEIWGYPLFVFFVPPTDPDGTYLIDRDSTSVSVGLAGPGTATLEWNGVNRSMALSGTNWSATVSGLTNGAYAYRVWATNATGTVFITPLRHLTVGIGIWRVEHIGYGFWPSLAVNASGAPRMCYYSQGLVYASRGPSGWTNTTIAGGGQSCSLALDSQGRAHISHMSLDYSGNFDLDYIAETGSGWSAATIETGYYSSTSIAINPVTDEPMIAYSEVGSQGLKLATLSGGTWTTQVVDPSFYGETVSLAIDPSGRPAIAYPDYTAATLRVAMWTGTQWTIAILETGVTDASIRFDAGGVAHVAYASPAGLEYATWNGTGWSPETVDSGRYYGVSLAFDSSGRPHIGYSMGWGADVREAVKNGTWRIQVITHSNGNGKASLATLDQGSSVAAFTLNDTNGDLVIASNIKDTQAPHTLVVVNGEAGFAGWYRSPVTVSLQAADDWSGVASVGYRLDGGPWTTYDGAFRISADGRHALEYRATDFAGNVEAVETSSIDLDLTPPDVRILAPVGIVTTSAVAVQWQGSDATSGVAGYEVSIDGGPATAVGLQATATVTLGLGPHTILVRATDVAGNVGISQVGVYVDSNPFSFSGPYGGAPTIALILSPLGAGAVLMLLQWRGRKSKQPPSD